MDVKTNDSELMGLVKMIMKLKRWFVKKSFNEIASQHYLLFKKLKALFLITDCQKIKNMVILPNYHLAIKTFSHL